MRAEERHGSIAADLLVVLASVSVLATTFLVLVPTAIDAAPAEARSAAVQAVDPEHQKVIDLLAALVGRSRAVLAVHPRGATPFCEIVLWLEDAADRDVINADEIAIISHSEVSQVLTFCGHAPGAGPGRMLRPGEIGDPAFVEHWRGGPEIERRIIARGISDLGLARFAGPNGRRRIEIGLTWPPGTSDRPDKASAVVDEPGAVSQE